MKKLILLAIMACLVQIVTAQKKGILLAELSLKGPVEEAIVYEYRGGINNINVDTTQKWFKTIMKFNIEGNELEQRDYDDNGKLQSKFLFDYKEDGTIIKTQFVDGDKLFCTYVFKYDGKGYLIEFDSKSNGYGRMAAFEDQMIYKYDGKGNMIEDIQNVISNHTSLRDTFLYNEKSQKIESDSYDPTGNLRDKEIYEYDSLGRVIKTEIYDNESKITGGNTMEYNSIDKYGNWIALTSENRGNSQMQGNYLFKHFTRRVIKYY